MRSVRVVILPVLIICVCLSSCLSEKNNDDNLDDKGFFDGMYEWVNPFSFSYDKGTKKMLPTESMDPGTEVGISKCRIPQQDQMQEYIFYKRLIRVLLANASLKFGSCNVTGRILIRASTSEFELLQDFADGKVSIREADRVLGNIIKEYERYPITISDSISYATDGIFYLTEIIKDNVQIMMILLSCIISYLWLKNVRWSPALIIFSIIVVILVVSFFLVWYQLIREAQIKLRVLQEQFPDAPVSCRPKEQNFFHKLIGSVQVDDSCLKFYQGKMSNPILEVTPALALSHLLATVVLHPISHSGKALGSFVDGVTEKLPAYLRIPAIALLMVAVALLMIIFPICLLGSCFSGKCSLWGISFGQEAKNNPNKSLKNGSNRIEEVDTNRSDETARPKMIENQGKESIKFTDAGNIHTKSVICENEDCCMASGDKIRKVKSSDSEKEMNVIYNHYNSREEKLDGRGDC